MSEIISIISCLYFFQVFFCTLILASDGYETKKEFFIWFIPILPIVLLISKKVKELD